jgi:hypothetical protein
MLYRYQVDALPLSDGALPLSDGAIMQNKEKLSEGYKPSESCNKQLTIRFL